MFQIMSSKNAGLRMSVLKTPEDGQDLKQNLEITTILKHDL